MEKTTITINVPDDWSGVTIGQYQEITSITSESPTARMIEVISILTNEDTEVIKSLEITSLSKIIKHLKWVSELPSEANYKPIITVDGDDYGFISRLSDLSIGEWIDLEHYLTDLNLNIHKIFAILYRPLVIAFNDRDRIIEEYSGESLERRADLFANHVNIGDVYGVLVFFSLIVQECIPAIKAYLMNQMIPQEMMNLESMMKQSKNAGKGNWMRKLIKKLVPNGLGTLLFTRWQREILQRWMKYLK